MIFVPYVNAAAEKNDGRLEVDAESPEPSLAIMLSMARMPSRAGLSALALRPSPSYRPLSRTGLGWAIAVSCLSVALAAAAFWNVQAALGLVILSGVGLAVALSPTAILPILVATVFVEMVAIGGVRITRLVAPFAMLVVLAAASRRGTQLRPAAPLFWASGYALWALASGLWTADAGGTQFLVLSLTICLVYMFAFAMVLTLGAISTAFSGRLRSRRCASASSRSSRLSAGRSAPSARRRFRRDAFKAQPVTPASLPLSNSSRSLSSLFWRTK